MSLSLSKEEDTAKRSLSRSFNLLSKVDQVKVLLFIGAQLLVSLLDTLGILLMGVVASLGLSLSSGSHSPATVETILHYIGVANVQPAKLLPMCGIAVVCLLLVRTVLSLLISLKTYRFLAEKSGEVSFKFIGMLLKAPFSWIRKQSVNDLSFALTQGVQYTVIGVLGQFIVMASEICILILIFAILIWVNPLMALVTSVFFASFGTFIYLRVGKNISTLAELASEKVVEGNQQVQNSLNLFREISIMSRAEKIGKDFKDSRLESGILFSQLNWLQLIPKFSVELAVVLGGFFLVLTSTITSGYVNAITDLVIFLAATSRLAPSALRLQQSLIAIRAFAGQSVQSLFYFEKLLEIQEPNVTSPPLLTASKSSLEKTHIPTVDFRHVFFSFDDEVEPVLKDITFHMDPGEVIALVGPSGSGKSTLCDLLLGLFIPSQGEILIDESLARDYVRRNPGLVSYLPQDTLIVPGTLSENVVIGLSSADIDEDDLILALKRAEIFEFVQTFRDGVCVQIGETGMQLSGGQRQRLGLARALYSRPELLVLDEPTSALDAETEDALMQTLSLMKGDCSILVIAHRLSTLRFVDKVMYMENGEILASGTVSDVRKKVPRFDIQAGLQGL